MNRLGILNNGLGSTSFFELLCSWVWGSVWAEPGGLSEAVGRIRSLGLPAHFICSVHACPVSELCEFGFTILNTAPQQSLRLLHHIRPFKTLAAALFSLFQVFRPLGKKPNKLELLYARLGGFHVFVDLVLEGIRLWGFKV